MLRMLMTASLVCLVALSASMMVSATADEGLCKGDPIDAFYVTKVAGAEDDGIDEGESLCYRCRYGSRPMVMVFAQQTGQKVTELVKQIDSAVADNADAQLRGLVTMFGAETARLTDSATKLAGQADPQNVPIVVSKDSEAGPSSYRLNQDVEITVVVASDSQVVARHEFSADSLDVAAVMSEVKSMLN
ncbi:MAG: hypothetical protein AAF670_18775 [Planctomycetota bacterium]